MGFWGKLARVGAGVAGNALAGPLGGFAASALVGGLQKKKKPGEPGAPVANSTAPVSPYQASVDRMTTDEGARADRYGIAYEGANAAFDPQSYAKETAGSLMSSYGELAGNMEADRRKSSAGRGFMGSPMGQASQTRDINTRLSRDLSSLSMEAGRMKQSQIGQMGDMAERSRDRASEMTFDRYATDRASSEEERRRRDAASSSKRSMWGSIGSAALGAAGTYLARR